MWPQTSPCGAVELTSCRALVPDFIYADVPYMAADSVEQYQKRYRQTFASTEVKELMEKVPMVNIFDDHEIYNVRPLRFLPLRRCPGSIG